MGADWALYLPQQEGLLPKWMLFVSAMAIFNTAQNFVTLNLNRKIYSRQAHLVNPLQSRTFGIWTLTSAAIRIFAAYNITNEPIYQLAIVSYVLALSHFSLELLVFRTAGLGAGLISPLIVASTSLVWMFRQYNFYVSS